mgnify:CR=1 FL=1
MLTLDQLASAILFVMCLYILIGSLYISYKMRFVQVRFMPKLIKMVSLSLSRPSIEKNHTILPYKALFTAMSTTLGIGTIVGPIIAIYWGGPGALIGFIFTSFLGSAVTYTEVGLCIRYRKIASNGEISGGPMPYLHALLSPFAAKWYAFFGCVVMTGWSSAQANQLAAILDSPLLGGYRIPTFASGAIISTLVLITLIGGIKRVSALSSKLIPIMFSLYLGATIWILTTHVDHLLPALKLVFSSFLTPQAITSGVVVGGVVSAMRWGMFKGTQATEAGVGTQTIPHSMAETNDAIAQGMLAMVSTYTAGIVALLSGLVVLVTKTWQDPTIPLGINMIATSFHRQFPYLGVAVVAISTFLFAFGTTLGNSFNGSQCFQYLFKRERVNYYYIAMAIIIFIGAISDVSVVWSVIDIALALLVAPHMWALLLFAYRRSDELLKEKAK